MAYTPKIVSSEKSVRNSVSQVEWGARVDLAAAYRYVALRGWNEDLGECRTISDLPDGAREYLDFIAEHVGAPIALVGVGPGREQTMWTDAGRQTILGANSLQPSA